MRCRLGGAEKRYARVFEMLVAHPGAPHKLLINRSMLDLLQAAGILTHHDPFLIVLAPPFRRYLPSRWPAWMVRVLRPLAWLLDALWYTWQCEQTIRRVQPMIVHPLLTGMYLSLPALLLHPRIRHVMSAYTAQYYRDKRILGVGLGATLKRLAMRRCQIVDALSDSIRADLISRGVDDTKIRVAPCSFTDLSLCPDVPQKEKWVVFLARFVEHKNPLLLARAIPQIVSQISDAHFFFLGRGPLQSALETLVRDLGVADYVTIRFEPHPAQILGRSSVFVSLQDRENYPSQSLLEAMICGNAIVATDVGETWRLVDEANGFRIPPAVDDVVNAIVMLLNNPQLAQLGLASRQCVLTQYTPERFFTYMTNVYRTAITRSN